MHVESNKTKTFRPLLLCMINTPHAFLNIQTFEFTPSKHFCDSTFCEFPFFTSGQKIARIFTHHVRFW